MKRKQEMMSDEHQEKNGETEVSDPNCVPDKPYKVTFQDVTSASFVIKSGIEYTPCTVNVFKTFKA